jgi:hypothetical protein
MGVTITLAGTLQTSSRIAAAYVLYSLYSSHPISMNPFRSALLETFESENQLLSVHTPDESASILSPQLTWVLLKVLSDQGEEVRLTFFAHNVAS